MVTRAEKKAAKLAAGGKEPAEAQAPREAKSVRQVFGIYYTRPGRTLKELNDTTAGHPWATKAEAEAAIASAMPNPSSRWSRLTADGYTFFADALPWQMREQADFKNGNYKPVIWHKESFWVNLLAECTALREQFAHVGVKDPTMVAYTPSPEDGERDRQAIMKPGKYLQKFFGAGDKGVIAFGPLKGLNPRLTATEIAYYAEWWEKGSKPSVFGAAELLFASTPEDIALTYDAGPQSCMSNSRWRGTPASNPARIYGAGDLALAYLRDNRRKKPIFARAICWPEKKVFGRIYPNTGNYVTDGFKSEAEAMEACNELENRLKAKGWASILANPAGFQGAKLLKLPFPRKASAYYMPYIDSSYGPAHIKDDPKFFQMSRSDTLGGSTQEGYVIVREYFNCPHCESKRFATSENGGCATVQVYQGWDPVAGPLDVQTWCAGCGSHYAKLDQELNARFTLKDQQNVFVQFNNAHILRARAKHLGYYQCAVSSRWYDPKVTPPIKVNNHIYAATQLDAYGYVYCTYDRQVYYRDDMSRKFCGFPRSLDADKGIGQKLRDKHNPMLHGTYDCTLVTWVVPGPVVNPCYYLQWFAEQVQARDRAAARRAELAAERNRINAENVARFEVLRADAVPVAAE